MRASLLVVAGTLAGGLAGAAGTYFVLQASGEPSAQLRAGSESLQEASSYPGRPLAASEREAQNVDAVPMSTSDRLALYAYAAERSDPDELEALIRRAAALPPSHRRSFELDALLTRLAESDPARAVRQARALRLETELLVPLFQSWAERDPRATLSELRGIDNPAAVLTIALALLDVFGNDERGIARLESVLSESQMRAFRVDAVVRFADRDPLAALQRALSLPDLASRSTAITRLAGDWARRDPDAALAQVEAIADDALRGSYQNAVITEWARIDPDAVVAYLRSEGARGLPLEVGLPALQSVAAADPDSVLALADDLPFEMRMVARQFALQAMAEQDLSYAIQTLESIPNLRERSQLASAIANAYARRDPDGALAWAMSLRPDSLGAVSSVLSVIAETDPERAVDLALRSDMPNPASSMLMMNLALTLRDSNDLAALADRVVARGGFSTPGEISTLLSAWSSRDPEAALDWFIANADNVDGGVVGQIAAQLASRDPEAASRALDRLPSELRGNWLAQAAAGYAEYDPDAAVTWVMQYQGQPGFDQAVMTVVQRTAMSDPQGAIRLIERLGRPLEPPVAVQIAASWASSEPAAAADWALRLPDAARSSAIGVVASNWSARDPEGAKRWALNLPSGALRDDALGAMVPATALGSGTVDAAIMEAFSNDMARQQAVLRIVGPLAGRNEQEAQRLVDTYVTDAALRQQAETMMTAGGNSSISAFFTPNIAIRSPGVPIRLR